MIEMSTHVNSECHLPLIVMVLARASIFVDNRVNEFIAYIAVCVGLAAVIPLLRSRPLVFSAECVCRLTLTPIKHSVSGFARAYHFS